MCPDEQVKVRVQDPNSEENAMPPSDSNSLIGVWKLKSAQFEIADTGEIVDVFGPNPSGYLIHTAEGRMMAVLTRSDRAPPKEAADGTALFQTMMAYSGNFRIDNDKFTTLVDVAWNPAWIGTEQTRFFKIEDDTLSITTALQANPMLAGRMGRGILTWTRA
jgi:Lipocalin-like domain